MAPPLEYTSTSGRSPLQVHAELLQKTPEVYPSCLSADETRIHDSIQSPLLDPSSQQWSIPPAPPVPPTSKLKPKGSRNVVHTRSCLGCWDTRCVDTWDKVFFQGNHTDVTVYTSKGYELRAHSEVLMRSSSVFRCVLHEQFKTSRYGVISIRGVPFQAVRCFLRFLYSSRFRQADMERFAIHLLALGHAYMIPALKRVCTESYEHRLLNSDNVVDVLQMARLCDAPRLELLCFRRIVSDFNTIAQSCGWRVMKETNPHLAQELVEAAMEADTRKRDRLRKLEEGKVYAQLHDATEALVHIFQDDEYRSISPLDRHRGDCSHPAYKGLASLLRHFAACKLMLSGECVRCKRMLQLLELHSHMCTLQDQSCKVPFCRDFKERVGQQLSLKREIRWKMLVCKVKSAKAACRHK